ncbi:hypothetical protein L3X38_034725 [Prunus dulcis]|uniref:Uncharacterized protein n=1 Tax=Prunus dulcis TaxID=3755 RepID=A0AAD4VKL6_PRUDU|nr:hypothetical protein L3X38_034725 [Prunus dulcis]
MVIDVVLCLPVESLEVLKNFVTLPFSKSYSARGIWSWPAYGIWYLSLTTTIEMEFDSPDKAIQDKAQKKQVLNDFNHVVGQQNHKIM